jgi:hypothetical protein
MFHKTRQRILLTTGVIAASAAGMLATTAAATAAAPTQAAASKGIASAPAHRTGNTPVKIEVFAPEHHDNAGIEGKGWFVDMELTFPGGPGSLARTGFSGLQLTGPAAHNGVAPFPGSFSTGHDDRNPGLVVLTSTTNANLPGFSGPRTNLANLFNITGVTNRTPRETELWDTWIVGAPIAGQNVDTTLTVAEVADLNHDGIFNDAPDVVDDLNHDGRVDAQDLKLLGIVSNVVTVPFHINGDPA